MGGMYMDNFLYSSLQITQYNQYWRSQCEMTVNKTEDEMGRFHQQDSQEFKRDKKCTGIFEHQRDTRSLSVLSVIYGDGVTRFPLSFSGSHQNLSSVELNQKISKLECPRQTWRTTVTRNKSEKAYDINTYRAVHRPSTTMSLDMSIGTLKQHLHGSTSANHREPLPISYRSMQSSAHSFQNQRNRSLIPSEEDKSHLTVVCQPISSNHNNNSSSSSSFSSSYHKHPLTRPLWSRNWRKEPTDSTTAFEELQFSPNYPVKDKCSFDSSLTPQIMACFINPEEVNEMSQHPETHSQTIEPLNLKSEDSRTLPVDQISEDEEENAKEVEEEEIEGTGVDGGDSESVPLFDMASALCASELTKEDDEDFSENAELKLNDYPNEGNKDLAESNNGDANVCHKDNKEETRGDNQNVNDFDTKSTESPAYLFKEPLPYPLNKLDINQMSRERVNWREVVRWHSMDPLMHSILDRLFEIDQLQHETEENEIRKALTKQAMRMKPRSLNSRQVTSVTLKLSGREKQCTENCLQSVSANDGLDKQRVMPSSVCHSCYQSLFGRNDQEEYSYDQQSRLPADKELWRNLATSVTSVPTVAIRPRSCNVDHPRHSPSRLSVAPTKSHRPKSSTVSSCRLTCSSQEVTSQKHSKDSPEGLLIDLKTPISRPKSTNPKHSVIKCKGRRNSLVLGKGHHSTERNSTTNPDNQDPSLIVHSARSDRKVKKKEKRSLTSISLLDL